MKPFFVYSNGSEYACLGLSHALHVDFLDWNPFACTPDIPLVLAAGGFNGTAQSSIDVLSSSEIYNTSDNSWKATGDLQTPRTEFAMVRLHDGKVLAAGGVSNLFTSVGINSTEVTYLKPLTCMMLCVTECLQTWAFHQGMLWLPRIEENSQ